MSYSTTSLKLFICILEVIACFACSILKKLFRHTLFPLVVDCMWQDPHTLGAMAPQTISRSPVDMEKAIMSGTIDYTWTCGQTFTQGIVGQFSGCTGKPLGASVMTLMSKVMVSPIGIILSINSKN